MADRDNREMRLQWLPRVPLVLDGSHVEMLLPVVRVFSSGFQELLEDSLADIPAGRNSIPILSRITSLGEELRQLDVQFLLDFSVRGLGC